MLWKENPRETCKKLFSLYTGLARHFGSHYKLWADGLMEQGKMSVLQWNKHPTLLIHQVRLILFNTNLMMTKNYLSYVKTILKTLYIKTNFVK